MATTSIGFGPFSISAYDPFASWMEGSVNTYFNKKSEKRAYKRQLQLMDAQYQYAQRYAENSPSWNVKGLRDAGLNPILAVGGGGSLGSSSAPSVPSVPVSSTDTGSGSRTGFRFDPMYSTQLESQRLDNELKEDTLDTVKKENEVRRLEAEAKASVLRPVSSGSLEGEGKSVSVLLPSSGFKALQKAIRDDYDLRSEKYLRETTDAVMKYGLDVLKLLPAFRRKEILETMTKTIKTSPSGKRSTVETYTTHGPEK